jgi:hypothetical protein
VALQRHIANYTYLQQAFESDLYIAHAILKEITTSAANLQTTLDETFHIVSKLASISSSIASLAWWIWAFVLVCLVGLRNARIVIAFILISGKSSLRRFTAKDLLTVL